jgi:ligand-binding sensor domain-containing protein
VRRDPDDGCRPVENLASDSQGTLWVLDRAARQFHSWLGPHDSNLGTTSRCLPVYNEARAVFLFRDRHGPLWFPGGRGRIAFLRDDQRFDVPLPAPAAQDVALSMAEDFDRGLWVPTERSGLLHLRPSKVRTLSVAEGLPSQAVWALLEACDGSIWIGTDGPRGQSRNGGSSNCLQLL